MNISKSDWKYVPVDAEPGFSPEKNKAVVERTIKKYEAMRKAKMKQWVSGVQERTDALATFFKSRAFRLGTPAEKYFGKKWMAYLRGEKIKDEVFTRKIKVDTNRLLKSSLFRNAKTQ